MKNDYDYKKEKLVSITIVAASLIIMLAVILFLIFRPTKVETSESEFMPSIVGYSFDEVKACYERFFTLEISEEVYSDDYPAGAILSQDIAPSREYIKGKITVSVVVSKGPMPVETTAPIVTEPIEKNTATVTESPLTDGPISNPPAEFESNYSENELEITVCGLNIPEGRGQEVLDELYALMRRHGVDAGLLYYDPESGGSIEYNADEKFSSGSIIKAIYARSILGTDFDILQKYEMTEELLNSRYEFINDQPVGTFFTVEELIRAAVTKSNNTAYKMLYHYIGYQEFNEYAKGLEMPQRMTDENYWFRLSARQTATYFKDIYFFIEQHVNGELMRECLANAEYREMFSAALPDKNVAEKYGYLPQENFYTLGDAGIVYDDKPYVLTAYVRGKGSNLNTEFFRRTATLIDELHELMK